MRGVRMTMVVAVGLATLTAPAAAEDALHAWTFDDGIEGWESWSQFVDTDTGEEQIPHWSDDGPWGGYIWAWGDFRGMAQLVAPVSALPSDLAGTTLSADFRAYADVPDNGVHVLLIGGASSTVLRHTAWTGWTDDDDFGWTEWGAFDVTFGPGDWLCLDSCENGDGSPATESDLNNVLGDLEQFWFYLDAWWSTHRLELDNVRIDAKSEGVDDTEGPTVSTVAATPNPVAVNETVELTATIDDEATGGSTIGSAGYTVDGGDPVSMAPADGDLDSATEDVTATVSFAEAGVYDVCVTGTDSEGNHAAEACVAVAVYDPSGGFTVGSGEVHSPPEADLADGTQGPARFVFVSKYAKGKTSPTGTFQFQFQDGDLRFRSTDQSWLVVTGKTRARFQGIGLLDDTTQCKYVVDAYDGSYGVGEDAFGLRIFACDGSPDRYDLDPQPLTRGDIKIQAK